jgi:hypothetical protein
LRVFPSSRFVEGLKVAVDIHDLLAHPVDVSKGIVIDIFKRVIEGIAELTDRAPL